MKIVWRERPQDPGSTSGGRPQSATHDHEADPVAVVPSRRAHLGVGTKSPWPDEEREIEPRRTR